MRASFDASSCLLRSSALARRCSKRALALCCCSLALATAAAARSLARIAFAAMVMRCDLCCEMQVAHASGGGLDVACHMRAGCIQCMRAHAKEAKASGETHQRTSAFGLKIESIAEHFGRHALVRLQACEKRGRRRRAARHNPAEQRRAIKRRVEHKS